ncbi:MAG: hypothetical protein Q7S35_11180 [Candidatus Limnocylindrales bacterium]|nr:hypothetical protein [Candidatus Limnocylindrales bacterium]
MNKQTFVTVGASLAGASAAAGLRKDGFDGRFCTPSRDCLYMQSCLAEDLTAGRLDVIVPEAIWASRSTMIGT